MSITIETRELPEPLLEFGEAGEATDPKQGLATFGPFSLRFGLAHKTQVRVGLVGPPEMLLHAQTWFARCQTLLPSGHANQIMYPDYPGFQEVMRATLSLEKRWHVPLDDTKLSRALQLKPLERFNTVLDLYAHGIERLANQEVRPDVTICCLPEEVVSVCRSVSNVRLTAQERKWLLKRQQARALGQLSLFEEEDIEETPEDLLYRDLRRALKARAMRARMPIQIGRDNLFLDSDTNQDPATRAWNVSVALFYKAGGIPWRLKMEGPETCFVGISFHHLKTRQNELVYSSLAQAFSSEGEGFALRGDSIPWRGDSHRQVHLSSEQAVKLARQIITEYRERTGRDPMRVVFHKTSGYDEAERTGFRDALRQVPIVELIHLVQRPRFRLVQAGTYPPRRGMLCRVNEAATYLFTTGYIPAWGTYPGPHIPVPLQLITEASADSYQAAKELLGLSRMNWNTARDTSGYPITIRFAREVGNIMAEVEQHQQPNPSYRYYM